MNFEKIENPFLSQRLLSYINDLVCSGSPTINSKKLNKGYLSTFYPYLVTCDLKKKLRNCEEIEKVLQYLPIRLN